MFGEFSRAMRQCSLAFLLVSVSNIVLTISQVLSLIHALAHISTMGDCYLLWLLQQFPRPFIFKTPPCRARCLSMYRGFS